MRFGAVWLAVLAPAAWAGPAWKAVQVDAWGPDTLRVRLNLDGGAAYNGPGALAEAAPGTAAGPAGAGPHWVSGSLQLSLDGDVFTARRGGEAIAALSLDFRTQRRGEVANVTALNVTSAGAASTVSYYGFGQHENGKLDQAGAKYDMESCIEYGRSSGGEVCLPWIMVASDLGAGKQLQYGLLWNVPAYGSVEFGLPPDRATQTWCGYNIDQVDVLLTTFSESVHPTSGYQAGQSMLRHYLDAVGHAPELPGWASGYWHSRNRYSTQGELEGALETFARNYSIPVSVIVVDYNNWAVMGDLTFDPARWPDPRGMVSKVKGYGTELMVSTWPFSNGRSKTYSPLQQRGLAVFSGTNTTDAIAWSDPVCGHPCRLYDASNSAARAYWWANIKAGYFDYGIKAFWLDAAEPEQISGTPAGSAWSVGSAQRVGMMFPWYHTKTYHDGMRAAGVQDGLTLSRSAWAGMSRHRAVLWNGDTSSRFESLAAAIRAGQSAQLSGIAWWTTDIGGYAGGDPADPTFRELAVRWFQFGLTCPIFRQHGHRATEPWLLGDEAFAHVRSMMALREHFRPYVMAELQETAASGLPLNRPIFFDFPGDAGAWNVSDQLMFGRDYMAAPVYEMGARSRTVYFPRGATWTHHFTGASYAGGSAARVPAPMGHFPLFKMGRPSAVVV